MSLGSYSWRTKAPGLIGFVGAFLLNLAFGAQSPAHPLPLKDEPVPGWPELQIETRYVARIALRGFCLPVPAGKPIPDTSLDNCARPDFWRGVCDVFIDVQYIGSADLREHAEKRCRGYDHRGDDLLAEALRAWRERGENRYADMLDFASMMFVLEPLAKCDDGEISGPESVNRILSRHASDDWRSCPVGSR